MGTWTELGRLRPRTINRLFFLFLSAATAAGLWSLTIDVGGGQSRPPQPTELAELIEAMSAAPVRPLVARLAGASRYVREPQAASGRPSGRPTPAVRLAAVRLSALQDTDAISTAAAAIGRLVLGDADGAVASLERATGMQPANARLHSDLASALFERAWRANQVGDYARAIDAANRAIRLDPALIEPWFNRALALDQLRPGRTAREAWTAYAGRERSNAWRAEAARRLAAIDPEPSGDDRRQQALRSDEMRRPSTALEFAKAYPGEMRAYVEDVLLAAWADDAAAGRHGGAVHRLAIGRSMAEALREATGDPLPALVITAIERASPEQAMIAARGFLAWRRARELYERDRIAESEAPFEEAGDLLARAGNPFQFWARLYAAIADYYAGRLDVGLQRLEPLVSRAERDGYLALAARARWMRGLLRTTRSDLPGGLQDYEVAARLLEGLGEVENAGRMHSSRADLLDSFGQTEAGWQERGVALRQLAGSRQYRLLHTTLQNAALACLRQDLPDLALEFQHSVVDNAIAWKRPPAVSEGYLFRARIRHALGDDERAREDLAATLEWAARVPELSFLSRLSAEVAAARAQLESSTHPAAAIRASDDAIRFFKASGFDFRLPRLLLDRGRSHLANGDATAAERDFVEGVGIYERQRLKFPVDLRVSYFDNASDLFTELVRLRVEANDFDGAFAYAERGRANAPSTAPVSVDDDVTGRGLSDVARRVPGGAALLYVQVLPARVSVWLVSRRGVKTARSTIDDQAFRLELQSLRHSRNRPGASGDDERRRTLGRLYDVIVRPVADGLAPGEPLVVVPDSTLADVPVPALWDRERRERLVEQRPVMLAPSARLAIEGWTRARQPRSISADRVLVVAADSGLGTQATFLPEVRGEVREIASLYPGVRVVENLPGGVRQLLQMVRGTDVFHFAGHARPNLRDPRLSHLVLPRASDGALVTLTAGQVKSEDWTGVKLVVLSACDTGNGRVSALQGTLSLARSFLEAGVPTVVASLWPVEDRLSNELMTRFHREFARSHDAAHALREAQRATIAAAPSSIHWSAFQVYGVTIRNSHGPRPDGQ